MTLVLGLGKAYLNDEHDCWGSSYKEAAEWLLDLKKRFYPEGKTMVLVAGDKSLMTAAQYYLARDPTIEVWGTRAKGQMDPLPRRYNFYIAMNSQGYLTNYPEAPIIHTVGRGGAIFSVIKARVAP